MRAVVTRVSSASVAIDGQTVGEIGTGFLVLLGIGPEDTAAQAEKLADKICGLRVFADEAGKMNRNLEAVGGALVVSQFTLYADIRAAGRALLRPRPGGGHPLYERFLDLCREKGSGWPTGPLARIWRSRRSMTGRSPFGWIPTPCNARGAKWFGGRGPTGLVGPGAVLHGGICLLWATTVEVPPPGGHCRGRACFLWRKEKEHQGLCPWTPTREEVPPRDPFSGL